MLSDYVLWGAVGANLLSATLLIVRTCRVLAATKRTLVLEELLRRICVDAFLLRHRPVWLAWTAAMGDIDISVTAIPRRISADPD